LVDPFISDLVDRYDRGVLSRRELVTGLSAIAAAGAPAVAAAQAPAPALKPTGIHHVSILVADLRRSAAFYERVFGLVPVGEDVPNKIVRLAHRDTPRPSRGTGPFILSLRQTAPVGTTDHWSFSIEGSNGAERTEILKAHGLNPVNNLEYGFHIKDPDGVVVQMV
jgi:catechol 2,3-dioxygenase-like lactoylglutathione lyase family enzyme